MTVRQETRTPPANCKCSGCQGLAGRYQDDPVLLGFYRMRLLQKGWAGQTDDIERAYQQAHAPWAKAAQERGVRLAQKHGFHKRSAVDGEAPKPPAEVNTTLSLF